MRGILQTIHQAINRQPEPVILMYHRIAEPAYDPWDLSVTPIRFAEQMRALKKFRVPLPMKEFVSRLETRSLPSGAVGVTFDDGYVDNLRVAKPILDDLGVPATIFLTTGFLGRDQEFWWDELARLTLGRREAAEGMIVIDGHSINIRLPAVPDDTEIGSTWRAWNVPSTERERLYLELWTGLRALALVAREEGMCAVRDLLNHGGPAGDNLPLRSQEVAALLTGNAIDIGAHSQTHPPLTTLSLAEQRQEIEGSRAACEALAGKPVVGFAYPHGDRDAATKKLVADCGFQWACSTVGDAVDRDHFDRLDLPRLQVLNWTEPEFRHALNSARRAA